MKSDIKPPTSFWIIGISALVWNIIELYLTTYEMDFLQENSTAEEFEMIQSIPFWYGILFVVALLSETLGIFMLLVKRKIASKLFMVSLISIVIIECYWVFFTNIKKTSVALTFIVPIAVIGIAIFLYVYSKRAAKKGWIR